MEKIVVDVEEINQYMKVMYTHLDEFRQIISKMKNLKNTITWEGMAATSVFDMYEQMIAQYLLFADTLMKFIDYLNNYTEGYNSFIDEIKQEFVKMNNEYNKEGDANEKN